MQLPFFNHMHRFLPALVRRNGGATISVEVRHRPRTRSISNYGLHNRLWVGIVDSFGVMWLQRRMNLRAISRGLIFMASLLALAYALEATHFGSSLNQAWIDSEIRGKGLNGELLFIGVGALATALAMPRQIISFLGGYAFGFVFGTLLTLVATLMGSALSFFYARWLGRDFITTRFGTRIKRIDDFLSWSPFSMSLLIRLLPVGNNLATNLAVGVTKVPALPFFLGSLLGYIPQTVVFALVGSGVSVDPTLRIGLAVVLFLVSGMIGVWLYRKYRHGHTLGAEVDAALDPEAASANPNST